MALVELPKFAKRTKAHSRPALTLLLPGDVSAADVRFLSSVLERAGIDTDRVNYVQRWEDVVRGHARHVVSFGKDGLDAWHRWGIVQVRDHGQMFLRPSTANAGRVYDGYWVMVCEHPAGIMQQTAWGYGVKEHLVDELKLMADVVKGKEGEGSFLSTNCLQCLHGRDSKRRGVEAYLWECDAITVCEDHLRRRSQIKMKGAVKKRMDKSKPEAQIPGQLSVV